MLNTCAVTSYGPVHLSKASVEQLFSCYCPFNLKDIVAIRIRKIILDPDLYIGLYVNLSNTLEEEAEAIGHKH